MYEQLLLADPLATAEQPAKRLLPLPRLLAFCLPWRIACEDLGEPLELSELADTNTVAKLDNSLLLAYQDVIHTELRRTLANATLPFAILESHVILGAIDAVRADLRRKGLPSGRATGPLTIKDALPFIGRRANRLLQCLDAATSVEKKLFLESDWIDFQLNPKSLKIGIIAARRQVGREQGTLRASRAPWLPMSAPHKWPSNREAESKDVCLTLASNLVITAQDARFGWALSRIHRLFSLSGQSVEAVETALIARGDTKLLADFRWLKDALEAACLMTTAAEAASVINALLPRSAEVAPTSVILGGRYGLGGQDQTLQECGDGESMTRERVRQLQAMFELRVSLGEIYTPRLLSFLAGLNQNEIETLPALHSRHAECLGTQTLSGAIAFASALGHAVQGSIVEYSIAFPYILSVRCWSKTLNETALSCIVRSARAMTGRIGAFHLASVMGDVNEELGFHVSRYTVKTVLDGCPQCLWLDEDIEWGTILGATEVPVLEEVRKMLAIAYPVSLDITDIFAGLAQCRRQSSNRSNAAARFGGGMPPPWIVRKLLDLQEDMEVAQYDNFRLKEPIDPLTMMEGEADKQIYQTLQKFGGIASWREMRQAMVDTLELNPVTFAIMLKSCSYIYQPGYGLYAFRGQRMFIQSVIKDGRQRDFSHGPGAMLSVITESIDGVLEFEVSQTSSPPSQRSRAVYVPGRIAERVAGGFTNEADPSLRIRIGKNGQIGRIAVEFEAGGVMPKDKVLLTLDLANKVYRWKPVLKSD